MAPDSTSLPVPRFDHLRAPAPMDTEEAARWLVAEGATVTEAAGVLWVRRPRQLGGSLGYWQPVAELSPVAFSSARWPRRLALGFRAVVADEQAANAAIPVWYIADLQAFDGRTMDYRQRRYLRSPHPGLRIEALETPSLLLAEGWPLVREATQRRGDYYLSALTEADYREGVARTAEMSRSLFIAATVDDRLVGYSHSFAINDIAYSSSLYLSAQGRTIRAGGALKWAAICAWRNAGSVRALSAGPQMPERPGVELHKQTLGIPRVDLPAVSRLRAPVAAVLRRRRPHAYFRSGLAQGGGHGQQGGAEH